MRHKVNGKLRTVVTFMGHSSDCSCPVSAHASKHTFKKLKAVCVQFLESILLETIDAATASNLENYCAFAC